MRAISPHELTPAITALFDITRPTMLRALNVLESTVHGQILVDDRAHPQWALVRDRIYGTLYLGGQFTADLLASLIHHFRAEGGVGISCWPDDPIAHMLPPDPDYDGATLYLTDRAGLLAARRPNLPAPYTLVERDAELLTQSFDYESTLAAFGSVDKVLRLTLGVDVLHEGLVVCEAATGAATHGQIEVGVTTAEAYRQQGLATSACARLIELCEQRGYATWWDCAKQNSASRRLARRLGYRTEREYRYIWWSKRE